MNFVLPQLAGRSGEIPGRVGGRPTLPAAPCDERAPYFTARDGGAGAGPAQWRALRGRCFH